MCIYIYVPGYIHVRVCTYLYLDTRTNTHTHIYIYIYIHAYRFKHVYVWIDPGFDLPRPFVAGKCAKNGVFHGEIIGKSWENLLSVQRKIMGKSIIWEGKQLWNWWMEESHLFYRRVATILFSYNSECITTGYCILTRWHKLHISDWPYLSIVFSA